MTNRVEALIQKRQRVAEKTKTLISLLRDPELKEFVTELTGEQPVAGLPANGSGKLPDQVTPAIRMIAHELPSPFTVPVAIQKLKDHKFDFGNRDEKDAVRDALYLLAKKREVIRVVSQGGSGKLSTYDRL